MCRNARHLRFFQSTWWAFAAAFSSRCCSPFDIDNRHANSQGYRKTTTLSCVSEHIDFTAFVFFGQLYCIACLKRGRAVKMQCNVRDALPDLNPNSYAASALEVFERWRLFPTIPRLSTCLNENIARCSEQSTQSTDYGERHQNIERPAPCVRPIA